MTYDEDAKKLAIKAIGTVESNLNYQSINYNDPITVGFMQWYGTRAASLLNRIQSENPTSWVGVPASLQSALDTNPASSSWWNDRFLTMAEGEPLRAVLNNNKAIQNAQAVTDFEGYKTSAVTLGIDPDGNTEMMLLFFSALHQSPARARRLIAAIGPSSSIDRLLSALLNEEVFGRYRTRYQTVYNIIKSGDSSGVGDVPDAEVPEPPVGGDTGGGGLVRSKGDILYIRHVGDALHVKLRTGGTLIANQTQADLYVLGQDPAVGAPVVPPAPNPDPTVPPVPGGSGDAVRVALVEFFTSRLNAYDYSQGGARLEPDKYGYTDCSGLTRYAYQQVAGIEIGTYTVAQLGMGTEVLKGSGNVDESKLLLGDLVLYNWTGGRNSVDHVDMYIGNGNVCGHGGPDKGPDIEAMQPRVNNAINWYIRRYV